MTAGSFGSGSPPAPLAEPRTQGVLEWTAYADSRVGLHLEHPADWRSHRGMSGLVLAIAGPERADGFAPNLNVVRRMNDVKLSLDELARAAVREVSRVLTDAALIDLDAAVIADSPARRLLFTYRQGIYGLTGEQWVWLTSDHIWTVTAGSATEDYDEVADVFAAIVASLSVDPA